MATKPSNGWLKNSLLSSRFNFAHRKLYNRLVQLGAQPFLPKGEADEQDPEGYVRSTYPVWVRGTRTEKIEADLAVLV